MQARILQNHKTLDKGTDYESTSRIRILRRLRRTAVKLRVNPKDRIKACGAPAKSEVEVISTSMGSKFRGLWSCDQVHKCPCCAAKIQYRRTSEIAKIIGAKGRWSIYLTLTLEHSRDDNLKNLLKTLSKCWNRLRNGTFGRRSKKYGQIGFVRTLDLTFSNKSGFHPHYAILLTFEEAPTQEQIQELKKLCFENWKAAVKIEARNAVESGFYFDTITNPDDTAAYLAKINSIAWEVGSNTFKKAANGHLNQWQILEMAENSSYFAKVWRDYEVGIKGSRAIHYSKNFKNLLEESEEEEILEDNANVLLKLRSSLYWHIRKIGDADKVLEICDRSLNGNTDAQLILKGIKKISSLCPVDEVYLGREVSNFNSEYESDLWKPLHSQLSLFSSS
jgi:hypothetical protein